MKGGVTSVLFLLIADEVCGWLRVPKSTLYKLCRERKIPACRVGRHWRFDRSSIERWLKSQKTAFAGLAEINGE
jgi:excisionase family DNA binding protein